MGRALLIAAIAIGAGFLALWLTISPLRTGAVAGQGYVSANFGGVPLRIQLALTEVQREKGLGGRTSVPKNSGMLFVFPQDGEYGFWMKDTLVPLDIFWLNDAGKVVYMVENVATSTYPGAFYPSVPARYVLETAAGFGQQHGIATGTALLLKKFPTTAR